MAFSVSAQREMLAALHRLAAEREAAEIRIRTDFETAAQRAKRELSDARQAAIRHFQMDRDATQREYDGLIARANSEYESRHTAAEAESRHAAHRARGKFSSAERRARAKLAERTWETQTVYEATHNAPKVQLAEDEKRIASIRANLDELFARVEKYLEKVRLGVLRRVVPEATTETAAPIQGAAQRLVEFGQLAKKEAQAIQRLFLPRLMIGARPWLAAVAIAGAICGAMYLLLGSQTWTWLIAGSIVSVVLMVAAGVLVYRASMASVAQLYDKLRSTLTEFSGLASVARQEARDRAAAEMQRLVEQRDHELKGAQDRFEQKMAETTTERDRELEEARTAYVRRETELVQARDSALAEAHKTYPARLDGIQRQYQEALHVAQTEFDSDMNAAQFQRDSSWEELAQQWTAGAAKVRAVIDEHQRENNRYFPDWQDPLWNTWTPATTAPPALRFGHVHVDLKDVPGGISSTEQFNQQIPAQFDLPALLPFPQNASLLLKASGEGRRRAIEAVQAMMLRMLTTIPPGKARFTIVDPVGLGENFAGFMHLADHDEQLVTNRIWTEPPHIEARLADLTEQMENVIQKYLRNEFRSIDEYNEFAGEVAEPFRILVVANFPVNFTDSAARRLTSIATSGARCGVYTLIVHDVKLPLPPQFDLKEVERSALTLQWNGKQFVWPDETYRNLPLKLDSPPPEEQFTRLVQVVGRGAKLAKRVEVPFDHVAPAAEARWKGDTSRGIQVPLGRAGATKLQSLKLGEGTAQHVLIAGKTGSGKSTLLHALVTNVALMYGPDQIELYLIDFKKGVEFKTYATHQLPHARVIAIESEREFGLSVLEKLDAELKRRGDLYREVGAQDVAGYRAAKGAQSMPRILLIVDEFQELFTEDDKLAQDAALLLDRLVRQGRAFGMHVLLGSQTLGGAYSLARSTIGQMAVRIALQCSEADAHMILSEENSAARLLSRPGEAIYNDANGLVHGNHPFQVVWLADERREKYLENIQQMATARYDGRTGARPAPPIVFEGNQPADISRNRGLSDLLVAADWPLQSVPVHAWMGEAIAIKDPTAAIFRAQSSANLLIIGQRPESAAGLLAAITLSLAAQHRPSAKGAEAAFGYAAGSPATFYILEHDRPTDLPMVASPADYRYGLGALAGVLPHPTHVGGRRELAAMLSELAAEVDRRQTENDQHGAAMYLFISDLGRFRDLRRDEDMGFSFGSETKPASTAQLLGAILRDGPAVGIHTIVWCDSLGALNRAFDRQTLREFSLRVLFQMSANDSSHLVDSPLASKLGPHVALFHNEEEGRLEKFRPYSWPSQEWISSVQEQFQTRLPAGNV